MLSILLLDNHDSFTYNLVETLRTTNRCMVEVVLLEQAQHISLSTVDGIILSPGPGLPEEKNGLQEFISKVIALKIPLLGVCLGHQAIAGYYGARLKQLDRIIHGEASKVTVLGDTALYKNLPGTLLVGRYHSWVLEPDSLPAVLEVSTKTEDGLIMSFKHQSMNVRGVQYHPESILTEDGFTILSNWLDTF
jgi:anthranilate synthase component 2